MNWKWVIILLALIGWGGTAVYANVQRAAAREAGLELRNVEAEADSAREELLVVLDDTVSVWRRLVVQEELRADSIDAELGARPVIRIPGELRVDTLEVVDTLEIPAAVEDQTFDWDGFDPPFSIQGSVALMGEPTPSAIVTARVVQVDPIPVEARVSCIEAEAANAVSVALLAEDPFSLIPSRTVADPDVCNARKPFVPSLWPQVSLRGIGYDLLKVVAGGLVWELVRKKKDTCSDCYNDDWHDDDYR
jgi:hypothetical protein